MKTNRIQLSDFSFLPSGYGHYKVTYTSPVTGKKFTAITNNMPLIDATKNAEEPKIKDLESLKRICKQ
jgi:hypothetical protein